ncbi:MAG: glutamate--cysteine ligase [Lamprobacter sp.]|uniref:glutamate--cysteine ligase n=1 Tax=Lamprobacter sp. TaxID=3100796 RepID=UPI002B25B84F|nr:glutamate--cysteine ligase [Lamprobacter sp.]MEA3639998.1 glutamate--cysteine ligase [Lamprobacter sp.]
MLSDPAVRALVTKGLVGLEKETLRVTPDGRVALTPHPPVLGSALTHPHITTDFSEALVELVTPALSDPQAVLDFLGDLHLFVYQHIGDERLWAGSMPCVIHGGAEIPLAQYGRSNAAQMKTVYRRGLGNRYGRVMQIIAGVHFNFSLPEAFWEQTQADFFGGVSAGFASDSAAVLGARNLGYMGMVRNLQRLGWMVPYLFGASPAVCKSFVQDANADLEAFDTNTLYSPFATSLRMGDIGYQNRQEEGTGLKANYDNLDAYTRSLTWAIRTPCPHYEPLGVKVNGRWEQLNDHVLQIENEYYSTVRPKQLTDWMEFPTLALRRRGIRYVELRSVDVNLFDPLGIELEQMHFLSLFMLYCLLLPSPTISPRERRWIDANEVLAAHRGREPGLMLQRADGQIALRDWGQQVLSAMEPLAVLIDGGIGGELSAALKAQQFKMTEPDATPSARVLAEMRTRGEGFAEFAGRLTEQHRDRLKQRELAPASLALFQRLADESRQRQAQIEAADDCDFDTFLARYFAQTEAQPVTLRSPFAAALAPSEELT